MPKRLTDTEKWDDKWYRPLSPPHKHGWDYLCDKCDCVGIIELDVGLAEFQIGEPVDFDALIDLAEGRIERISGGKLWLPKFVEFQYGELKPETSKPHAAYKRRLEKAGLYLRVTQGYDRGSPTHKDKDKDKEKDKGGCKGGKPIELPPILDSPEFRSALDSWVAYRGTAYKPRGLSALLSQAVKRAEAFGVAAVINAMEVAESNGWAGWNQDGSFKRDTNSDPRGNLAMRNRLREKMRK